LDGPTSIFTSPNPLTNHSILTVPSCRRG